MPFRQPQQYLKQAWGRLAYRRRVVPGASRPTLLFLHGLGGDADDWQATASAMPAEWPMVVVDLRGHGRSSSPEAEFELADLAADLWHLASELALGDFYAVGFGLGGLVAQAMAMPPAALPPIPAAGAHLRGLVVIESFTVASAKGAFRRGRYTGQLAADRTRKISAKYFATRDRFHPAFYDKLWASVIFFDTRPFLRSTELPVHHIFGDVGRDSETDRKLLLPIRPNIQLHWIPGGGHQLLHEQPDTLARKIVEVAGVNG